MAQEQPPELPRFTKLMLLYGYTEKEVTAWVRYHWERRNIMLPSKGSNARLVASFGSPGDSPRRVLSTPLGSPQGGIILTNTMCSSLPHNPRLPHK